MAGHLTAFLNQTEPLDQWQVKELRHWLKVLEEECELLGATPEDEARMKAIREQIARNDPEARS